MKIKEVKKRSECLAVILNLVLAIVAVAFMIGIEAGVVSGEIKSTLEKGFWAGNEWKPSKAGGWYKDTETGKYWASEAVEGMKKFSTGKNLGVAKIATGTEAQAGKLATWLGATGGGTMTGLVNGAQWAGVAYFATAMIGEMFGVEDEPWFKAGQYALSSGLFTFKTAQGLSAAGKFGFAKGGGLFGKSFLSPGVIGLGVGAVVFVLTYKKTSYKTFTFECQAWEAPLGGDDCEKCNSENYQCSEYRCRSLGQACEFVEQGADSICYNAHRNDVTSPMIQPWEEILTDGYRYTNMVPRPPAGGTLITTTGGKCVEPFTPIEFGIQTNKPAQCKVDYELGDDYDDMQYYVGDSSIYGYNHSQQMNLPNPLAVDSFIEANAQEYSDEEITSKEHKMIIENAKNYELYVRCRSPNGYYNKDAYVIKFCVEDSLDLTPPVIMETSIRDNQPVGYDVDEVPIIVYTNKPANCKWSRTAQQFSEMENSMTCAQSLTEMSSNMYYACSGNLTNVENRKNNDYYFSCESYPWKPEADRIRMTKSKKLTLIGTNPLNIDIESVKPEVGDVITGPTTTIPVYLELETQNGYKNGEAECYYSVDEEDYISFKETNSHKHKQRQDLPSGEYTYYFKCVDLGGNTADTSTTFSVEVDTEPPTIVRVLYDNNLKIITNEDATCYYSTDTKVECNYKITNGTYANPMPHETSDVKTEHFAAWNANQNYYIKCKDVNEAQPVETQCSMIVRAVQGE